MEHKVEELNQKIIANQSEWVKTFQELSQSPVKLKVSTSTGRIDYQNFQFCTTPMKIINSSEWTCACLKSSGVKFLYFDVVLSLKI